MMAAPSSRTKHWVGLKDYIGQGKGRFAVKLLVKEMTQTDFEKERLF